MKKSLLALAVLGAFASAASAQSSVTLSGMVDANVTRKGAATATGTTSDWTLGSSGSAFNNFTLSGREDLGGGMYAFFTLNHRFRLNNGTINSPDYGTGVTAGGASQPIFYRNAFAGLGGAFGELRMGRLLLPLQEMSGIGDAWYGGYTVASTHSGGGAATQRANNAIYYKSPVFSGLQLHVGTAAGEGQLRAETAGPTVGGQATAAPGAGGQGERPVGFALQYSAGPLVVAAAYDRNYAKNKTQGIYGKYNAGSFIVYAQADINAEMLGVKGVGVGVNEKATALSISTDIILGNTIAKVGYMRFNSDQAGQDASKFGVGAEYNLSKRTALYGDIGKVSGDRMTAAQKKTMFDLGFRHKF